MKYINLTLASIVGVLGLLFIHSNYKEDKLKLELLKTIQENIDKKDLSDFSFEQAKYNFLTAKVLLPTVKIAIKEPSSTTGTGVIISDIVEKNMHQTYVLTAAHVALIAVDDQEKTELTLKGKLHPIYVTIYQYDKKGQIHSFLTMKAKIVIVDQDKDIALLKLIPHKYSLSIAKMKDKNSSLEVGCKTIAVGCGLGYDPLISHGNFNGYLYDQDGNLKGTQNAPITYGNSGGPLYDGFSQEVAGINVALAGLGGTFISVPQNHISFFVPHTDIWEFLEKRGFGYILTKDLKDKATMSGVRSNFAVQE